MNDNTTLNSTTDTRGVTRLTLTQAETHNAFDDVLIAELNSTLNALKNTGDTRVLVLGSEGRSFSAGADLNWMKKTATWSESANQQDAEKLATMLNTLNEFPAPTIARVQGAAFGGGVGLVACCDMAIASARASFCLSEVKLGLIPGTISPFVLAAIGTRAARRYFLTAERFNAVTAMSLGLVNEVVEDTLLDPTVNDLVSQLLLCGPSAQRKAKLLIRDIGNRPVNAEVLQDTAKRIAQARASDEGREGIEAFLQKRQPNWDATDV